MAVVLEEVKPQETSTITYKVSLPSEGKFGYPAEVIARPLKVGELKALSVSGDSYWRVLKDTIQAVANGINVNDLVIQDFIYLVMAVRINSLGSDMTLGVKCPSCSRLVEFKVDLDKLPVKSFEGSDTNVVIDGIDVTLPRVGRVDFSKLDDQFELARACTTLSSRDFDELPASTLKKILEWVEERDFGIDLRKKVICNNCTVNIDTVVPVIEFFR